MTDPSLHTTQLHGWLDRMRAGDAAAREELFRHVGTRLLRLAHKMLRGFPQVARWEQTGDVLHNALPRLLRALESLRPDSVREFYGLVAEQLRRALIDLARHYQAERGGGAIHASSLDAAEVETAPDQGEGAADLGEGAADLERWSAFHRAVEGLPAGEREVFGLRFYHDLSPPEIAEVLGLCGRTVRRYWHSACVLLRKALHGEFPEP